MPSDGPTSECQSAEARHALSIDYRRRVSDEESLSADHFLYRQKQINAPIDTDHQKGRNPCIIRAVGQPWRYIYIK